MNNIDEKEKDFSSWILPPQRITTGTEGLDQLLYGGLPKGKSYLIAGEPGTGKTTLCLQYILTALRNGEGAIYVAIDERPKHIIQDAAALGWPDFAKYIKQGQLMIMDVSQSFAEARMGKSVEIDVKKLLVELAKHIKALNATRMVIDPIAPLVFGLNATSCIQEYIRSLIFSIDEILGTTTLLTSHIVPGSPGLSQYGVEEFVVSGVIKLSLKQINNVYVRTLFIRKMRGTATDLTEYVFDIVHEKGIVIRQAF